MALRSVLVYCDLRGAERLEIAGVAAGILGGIVLMVLCMGLVKCCVRRKDMRGFRDIASEERRRVFIVAFGGVPNM